ncbi:HAD family hydrolase [Campylobacter jejuni]|nr:HAD family hydrolase [Campylobacter jejuni]
MAMLKNAIDFEYEVVGKPSIAFYKEALNLIRKQNSKIDFEDIKIISDDFRGDLLKAKELGMKTLLVLSGKISDTKGLDTDLLDGVYPSVFEFLKELKMPNLEEFRNKIDAVDDKILELLNERMTYVKSIGELKQSSGGAIYRPERERAIINRLKMQI